MSEVHLKTGSPFPEIPNDGKLRLYSMRFCPYDQRANLILLAKKIPFHSINIHLKKKPEWFLEKSISGKVPTLEIPGEDEPLTESLVIAEYLDEKYPGERLVSQDPLRHARDKILIERFNAFITVYYKIVFAAILGEVDQEVLDNGFNGLEIIEKELRKRGTKFLAGDKIGFVDYMVWPWVERSEALPLVLGDKFTLDKTKFAKFIDWKEAVKEDEAVRAHFVSAENHYKFIKSYKENPEDPAYDMLL